MMMYVHLFGKSGKSGKLVRPLRIVSGAALVVAVLLVLGGCDRRKPAAPAAPVGGVATAQPGPTTANPAMDSPTSKSAATSSPVMARDLDPDAFASALAGGSGGSGGKPRLVDVRTPEEFASGHIEGALNIDLNGPDFVGRLASLPKDESYLLYCRSGSRSSAALETMKKNGFESVSQLTGGVGAWSSAGKPLVR